MQKRQTPMDSIAGMVGAAIGAGVVWYAGMILVIPAAAGVALFGLFTQTPIRPKQFALAIGVIAAHLCWIVVGALMSGAAATVVVDGALLTAALIWLCARPSRAAGLATTVLVGVTLALNLIFLAQASIGTLEHRALVVHGTLRLGACLALIDGLRKLASPPDPPQPREEDG